MKQPKQKQKSPVAAGPICKSENSRRDHTKLSPRMQRLLKALLHQPQSSRELVDAIPANNPPAYIERLRNSLGFEIHREKVAFTTIDRRSSWYVLYALTESDRKKAAELLQG